MPLREGPPRSELGKIPGRREVRQYGDLVTAVVSVQSAPTNTTAHANIVLPVLVIRERLTSMRTAAMAKQENAAAAVQWTAAHLDADSPMCIICTSRSG